MFRTDFDADLCKIPFYTTHSIMLPYVGSEYEESQVLMVGESHYINDQKNQWSIQQYYSWWKSEWKTECLIEDKHWLDTRGIVEWFVNDNASNASRSILSLPLKEYCNAFGIPIEGKINSKYQKLAFMNFFQIPSFVSGKSVLSSLRSITKDKVEESRLWNDMVDISTSVLDEVIKILEPKLVVFTSVLAAEAYKNCEISQNKVEYTVHPGCPWWNRNLKRFGGRTGKEELNRIFTECAQSNK